MGQPLKAVCAVAHPDDCVIFAKPFIDNHPEYEWSIVYLTYNKDDVRAKEMSAYWGKRGITTMFLGFKDDYKDQQSQNFNFWNAEDAIAKLITTCERADLILTHAEDGDYGHIHHILVNTAINLTGAAKVYFANNFKYNVTYTATTDLDLDQFPLHKDVISQFENVNCGLYFTTENYTK